MQLVKYILEHNIATSREICQRLGMSEASFSQKKNKKNTSVKDHESLKIKEVVREIIREKEKNIDNVIEMLNTKEEIFSHIRSILCCETAKDLLLFNGAVIEVTNDNIEVLKDGKTKVYQYYEVDKLIDYLT